MTTNTLHKKDSSIFGGEIDLDDFNTNLPNKKRISNQIEADKLSKNIKEEREMRKLFLDFTLEELREMKLISNTDGRPTYNLTDEKWQTEFKLRKYFITPCCNKYKKLNGKYSREFGYCNETHDKYNRRTNWQEYCCFINDILNNIRAGQRDYCYYIYQILDLLKFHYNDLKTKYCDGYWEVWLER